MNHKVVFSENYMKIMIIEDLEVSIAHYNGNMDVCIYCHDVNITENILGSFIEPINTFQDIVDVVKKTEKYIIK